MATHTVKHTKMRTKSITLAAACLAGGMFAASAQSNVYSLNIVGYANVVSPVANQFALLANPLDNGTNNNITGLFPSAPNGTQIQIWTGSSFQGAQKAFGNWNTNLALPPGIGFFIKYPAASGVVTNTFVGNVLIENSNGSSGGTNSTALANAFQLVGSKLPVGGNLTAAGDGTLNLGAVLGNGSQILVWNGTSYQGAQKAFGNWNTNLNLSIGQGFFVKANAATNWVQVLP